jgi:hypothetical protein
MAAPMMDFNGVFFGRTQDGSVRVLRLKSHPMNPPSVDAELQSSEVLVDLFISPASWATMVAGVSASGNTSKRHYEALAFHSNVPP